MILFFSCRVEWKNGSLFSQRSTLLLCRWYRPFVVVGEKKVVSVARTIIHQLRRRFTADLTSIIVRTRVGQNFVLFFLEAAPLHRLVKFCIFFSRFFFSHFFQLLRSLNGQENFRPLSSPCIWRQCARATERHIIFFLLATTFSKENRHLHLLLLLRRRSWCK